MDVYHGGSPSPILQAVSLFPLPSPPGRMASCYSQQDLKSVTFWTETHMGWQFQQRRSIHTWTRDGGQELHPTACQSNLQLGVKCCQGVTAPAAGLLHYWVTGQTNVIFSRFKDRPKLQQAFPVIMHSRSSQAFSCTWSILRTRQSKHSLRQLHITTVHMHTV